MPNRIARWCFPEQPRVLPHQRLLNIAARTIHLVATGVLLGGHAFDVTPDLLQKYLLLAIATGVALIVLESYSSLRWIYQGRGILVLAKLGLLVMIPFFWSLRFPILIAVVIIASVGSHMSSRYRYYSVLDGRVVSY